MAGDPDDGDGVPPTLPASSGARPPEADPGRTLMHDPNEPHPWDEEGPPTGELQTHGDTAAGSDPGSDVGGEEPPSFTELDTGGIEDLPAATERSERARAVAIGLLLGAGIGLAIVAILARVAASWR